MSTSRDWRAVIFDLWDTLVPFPSQLIAERDAALAETLAESAVAAQARETRHHQIAQTTQAREGVRLRAARHAQPAHFRNRARDQRGFRVVTKAEAITHAGADGDDVLERAAQFHAVNV